MDDGCEAILRALPWKEQEASDRRHFVSGDPRGMHRHVTIWFQATTQINQNTEQLTSHQFQSTTLHLDPRSFL